MGVNDWNKDDLDFDQYGRLVIKNEELAKRIFQDIGQGRGLLLNIPAVVRPDPEPIPPFPAPMDFCPLPNSQCPDTVCDCDAMMFLSWAVNPSHRARGGGPGPDPQDGAPDPDPA